ncbi:uncharacterized protein LOC142320985 [Lycorma delicatula]|uniref:uncharacterized protein LOC142320985 n=1 Tax=Lycorma delicatula TaxID=130591 RepID=UPI003F511989
MFPGPAEIVERRKKFALHLINKLNHKNKTFSQQIWDEIHLHSYSVGMCQSIVPVVHSSHTSCDQVTVNKNLHAEDLDSKQHHIEYGEGQNFSQTALLQLQCILQGREKVCSNEKTDLDLVYFIPDSISRDSGYDSERLLMTESENDTNYGKIVQSLIVKVYKSLINELFYNVDIDDTNMSCYITVIKKAVNCYEETAVTLRVLLINTIKKILQGDGKKMCSRTEYIFKVIEEMCKHNSIISLEICLILVKELIGIVSNSGSDLSYYNFCNVFHIINTFNVLFHNFYVCLNVYFDKNNQLFKNVSDNKKDHIDFKNPVHRRMVALFKEIEKNFVKSIQIIQKYYHLSQVLIMMKRSFVTIQSVKKIFRKIYTNR